MPWAVSNSTPLIGLSIVGHLELLREFYGEIWIPPAVWQEVVDAGQGLAGSREVAAAVAAGWMRVVVPPDPQLDQLLKQELDAGEAEAIALAVSSAAEVLAIDERAGRQMTQNYNLNIIGTVGLLTRAAQESRIISLRDDLDRLRGIGFRISNRLYRNALNTLEQSSH